MAQPVMKMTKPGMKLRLGAPRRVRLSHMPARPAAHQMTPIVVCWMSLATQGPPHLRGSARPCAGAEDRPVLGPRVDEAPGGNEGRVKELL
jgi:hypothetical protein